MVLPAIPAMPRRIVSTSGSSGIEQLDFQAAAENHSP
jgi:hypothetical protein